MGVIWISNSRTLDSRHTLARNAGDLGLLPAHVISGWTTQPLTSGCCFLRIKVPFVLLASDLLSYLDC